MSTADEAGDASEETPKWISRSWYDDKVWADSRKKARPGWWDRSAGDERSWSWQAWESTAWSCDAGDIARVSDDSWIMEPSGAHRATLIFFHSCHGRPQHTSSFVDDLRQCAFDEDHTRIVAPCAPLRITDLDKEGTFQWFEYRTEQLLEGADQDDIDKAQLLEQRKRMLLFLNDELQKLPSDGRLVIGGLSQGASMVVDLLLHLEVPDERLCGAFFKRGFVQKESIEDLPGNVSMPIFKGLKALATHGVEDDWVPFAAARKSYELLSERGCALDFRAISGLKHNGYDEVEARALAEFVSGLLQTCS